MEDLEQKPENWNLRAYGFNPQTMRYESVPFPQREMFVCTMYLWGDREEHSYVFGVWEDMIKAITAMLKEEFSRGGKYTGELIGINLDTQEKRTIVSENREPNNTEIGDRKDKLPIDNGEKKMYNKGTAKELDKDKQVTSTSTSTLKYSGENFNFVYHYQIDSVLTYIFTTTNSKGEKKNV